MDDIDGLYAKYGKPLEAEHWGKYIGLASALPPTGRTGNYNMRARGSPPP